MKKLRDWWYTNIKGWFAPPCDCCGWRTSLSVCRKEAIKDNWDTIKSLNLPGQKGKNVTNSN